MIRITPAKIEQIPYMQQRFMCLECKKGDEITIIEAEMPASLMCTVLHRHPWCLCDVLETCHGRSAYGKVEDVIPMCCLAHCRRKFCKVIPKEHQVKSYVTARKAFLFYDTADGAKGGTIVLSIIEKAKANGLKCTSIFTLCFCI